MADPGEGPGGPDPPLFLDQTEARRVEKYIFLKTALALSQGLDDRGPPLSEGLNPPLYFTHVNSRVLADPKLQLS